MSADNPYAPPESDIETPASYDTELAGRGARLGGSILDGILITVVFMGIVYALGMFDEMATAQQSLANNVMFLAMWLGVFLIMNGYLLATRGQTIGKLAVGTRIVSIDDGNIPPFWRLIVLRLLPFSAIAYIPVVGQILSFINPLFIFRADRRCVHDHIAGTKVIVAVPLSES